MSMSQLVSLWRNKSRPSSQVKTLALKHGRELELKLLETQAMLKTLKDLTDKCHGDQRPDCPILDDLEVTNS